MKFRLLPWLLNLRQRTQLQINQGPSLTRTRKHHWKSILALLGKMFCVITHAFLRKQYFVRRFFLAAMNHSSKIKSLSYLHSYTIQVFKQQGIFFTDCLRGTHNQNRIKVWQLFLPVVFMSLMSWLVVDPQRNDMSIHAVLSF